jgi:type IV pilus assembly protein PilF
VLKRLIALLLCWCVSAFLFGCATDSAKIQDQARVSRRLGEGYLAEGNLTAALSQFLEAQKIYDKDPFLHYDMGLAYFGLEKPDLAISHFKKAVTLNPDYSEAFNAMGRVYGNLEQWDMAISCFNQALSNLLYATPHIALSNLGDAYRGKKDYQRAIDFYKQAIRKNPHFPNAHRGLGLTYMDRADYKAAVASLRKAVRYAPGAPSAYFDLGLAYARQHETEKAISSFKRILILVPDTPLADRALAEIKKLRQ